MDTKKYKFYKLTPIRDVSLKAYRDALDYVFSDDDLKNIAITGPYSSGKSSMLETYKTINKDKKFVHISLAHFETATDFLYEPEIDSKRDEVDKNIFEKKTSSRKFEADIKSVEGKILNQLIHQIDVNNIPQTHFKIKRPFSSKKMLMISAIITMFFGFLIFLINRNAWTVFVNGISEEWLKFLLSPTISDWFVVASIGICSIIFSWGLFNVLKLQHNKNLFKKLNIKGNEIEIFENDNDSFFNKHLNEVLYLFRNIKADAIVFEDIDRYNSNQIFEKLREINYLLNNSPNKNIKKKPNDNIKKKPNDNIKKKSNDNSDSVFRFFYLIRDDIFDSKDRTKFFDFIIPIVPVIDGANSYEKFIEYFKSGGILDCFDLDFLQEISTYIDDMRLLKNIYNEYQVYHERIQLTELRFNKLLGMIIYKNLFPRDFSELQLGKGYVFCLFRKKEEFIESEINKIEERIADINNLFISADQEQLRDLNELDTIFLTENKCIYDVNGKESGEYETRGEFVRAMKEHPDQVYSSPSSYGRSHNRGIANIKLEFEKLLSIPEYQERKRIIEAKTSETKSVLYDELDKLKNRKIELESATLSEIIQISKKMSAKVFASVYIDEINVTYNYEDVKSSCYFPLIKYLVRNKHIDENYANYMSYFYEQSISRLDQIFLRSVFDVEAKPFTYALKDPDLVSNKISTRYYSQPEVLNFDLFDSLLKLQNEKLFIFLEQLRINNRIDFVMEFWQTGKEIPSLFRNINKAWNTIWYENLTKEIISGKDKNRYLIDTFYYSLQDDIENMNIEDSITRYISSCADFLSISDSKIPLIIDALELLRIRFDTIDYEYSNKELFSEVYSRNLYEINKSMIFLILKEVYKITETKDFYYKNYSLIMSKPDEPLAKYIESNMNSYLDIAISICDGKINDDEEYAILLLNNPSVEKEHKENYIDILTTQIEKLTSINDFDLWPLLLRHHRVPCSKENVISYYFNSGDIFDETLTKFINESKLEKGLKYNDISDKYGDEKADDFCNHIIVNNNLENEKYTDLLLDFGKIYTQFNFSNIDNDKMDILIKLNILKMNAENLIFIRENYAECKMCFIISNINEYAQSILNEETFDISELKYLLKKQISNENLLNLLILTDEPISIEDLDVSDEVKKHIIENNYYRVDLVSLISSYEKSSSEIKAAVYGICIREIEYIIDNAIKVPYSLIIELLKSSSILIKRELVASQLGYLNINQAMECFNILKMDDLLTVFGGKWPSIEIDAINTSILEIMKKQGWISSFAENRDKSGYYRVIAKARRNSDSQSKLPDHLL